jgi:hypothetical protein
MGLIDEQPPTSQLSHLGRPGFFSSPSWTEQVLWRGFPAPKLSGKNCEKT